MWGEKSVTLLSVSWGGQLDDDLQHCHCGEVWTASQQQDGRVKTQLISCDLDTFGDGILQKRLWYQGTSLADSSETFQTNSQWCWDK